MRRDGSPHTVTRERLLWPLNRAVCEIGGALGLYLGLSVLSLLEAAFSLFSRLISTTLNRSSNSDIYYKFKFTPICLISLDIAQEIYNSLFRMQYIVLYLPLSNYFWEECMLNC